MNYTKGDCDEILRRTGQIHTVTLYCPVSFPCVRELLNIMEKYLKGYSSDTFKWKNVPTIDILNIFIITSKICSKDNINMDAISIICGAMKVFNRLKFINLEFTDDNKIAESYNDIVEKNKDITEGIGKIFKIDVLEMNLSNMFSQEIIDIINKVMIINEMIPNSYLKRRFLIDFKYDEYISYMDMFLGHNGPMLNSMDKNICDYLRTFPELVNMDRPNIRVITNYGEL